MSSNISLSAVDIFVLVIYGVLIFLGHRWVRKRYDSKDLLPYYYSGWLFKVLFAFLFAVVYLFFLGGGDINAYWDGASCLADLFYSNPEAYFSELWETKRNLGIAYHFNGTTGFPPGWIWREEEAWNSTKIISLLAIITNKGFWTVTLILSTFAFWVSWLLAVQLNAKESMHRNTLLSALFFVPSVCFWCSGISKDSLLYTLALLLIYQFFSLLKWKNSFSIRRALLAAILLWFIYSLRHYLAYALAVPLILAWMSRYGSRFTGRPVLLWLFRLVLFTGLVFSFSFIINSNQTRELIAEANVTKSDFSQNPIYSGAKYDMPFTTGSPGEILALFPLAVFTALLRPSILDPVGASYLLNQLESLLLLWLIFRFLFLGNSLLRLRRILSHEFLLYSLIFVLIVAFMAGYSSILYGVLVRIRSIALPFFILLLLHRPSAIASTE